MDTLGDYLDPVRAATALFVQNIVIRELLAAHADGQAIIDKLIDFYRDAGSFLELNPNAVAVVQDELRKLRPPDAS